MFKGQNKYSQKLFLNKYVKIIFVMFLCFWFLFNFSFWLEIKIGDALDRLQNKIERNSQIDIWGKAIVDDIYKKSLNIIQENNMAPMFEALEKTTNYVNDNIQCQLNVQDIVNIMYFANSSFKSDLKSNLWSFVKPTRSDMWQSCNKLNVCVFNPKWWLINNTPTLNQSCQSRVEKDFLTFYINAFYLETMWWWNKWSNYFRNFTLDDSSYDIMNDIYGLANILFQDIDKPIQTLFYKMPSVNYDSIYQESPMNMDIDWFSPYNNYTTDSTGSNDPDVSWWTAGTGILVSTGVFFEDNIDDDIKNFVESINFDVSNPWTLLWWNQCFTGFEFEWSSWVISKQWQDEVMTPGQYLSGILEDIAQVSCNNDGICDSWETTTCPDCTTQSWSQDFEEIQSLLENMAEQSDDEINIDDPVLWCFQKCQSLPCNATNCDKLVCYAKCSCQVYQSPIFDPLEMPWLTSVFKIKFCIIPVMENKLDSNKTVYNIASIFSEIHNVLQNLRNSGQMTTNVKTKEFLDSSKKENSFADQMSFSINSTTKSVVSNKSELTQTQEQIEGNTILMESVLWFSKDPDLESEKDKYVVMDDPCKYKVAKQASSGPDQASVLLENCRSEMKMDVSLQDMDLESAMQDQKVVLVNNELDDFLIKNRDFWYEVSLMFSDLVETAKVLSNK